MLTHNLWDAVEELHRLIVKHSGETFLTDGFDRVTGNGEAIVTKWSPKYLGGKPE